MRDAGYHFTTVTPNTHARVNVRPENAEAQCLADVFGWSRPFRPSLLPSPMLDIMEQGGVLVRDSRYCRSLVRVSTLDGELFFHSAFPTTDADSVFFGPDTYRFANAIRRALRERDRPVCRVVDIGCGAGPGGIVAAKVLPDAEVFMVDINEAALRLARVNVQLAGVTKAEARRSDLLTSLEGSFDLIVANPPYLVDPAQRAYRHGGGPLGADLSLAILDTALERLSLGGTLVLYTGAAVVNGEDPFRAAAADRLSRSGARWAYREMDPDVFGEELEAEAYRHADRIAAVVLTVDQDR
ncbi:methyltransferase [Dankookia rubra]|uniref:methyltransferase n=1 Tax=Dankookia rubra TaxID=1442381 RepID=UPI001F4F994F|nr:class I SAM-dependent methyltransferase [Dankookia rubra]